MQFKTTAALALTIATALASPIESASALDANVLSVRQSGGDTFTIYCENSRSGTKADSANNAQTLRNAGFVVYNLNNPRDGFGKVVAKTGNTVAAVAKKQAGNASISNVRVAKAVEDINDVCGRGNVKLSGTNTFTFDNVEYIVSVYGESA